MSRWLAGLRVALRSLFRRHRVEEELDEEIQYHLERQIDEGLKDGLAPDEARYAALRAMGAIARSKEECRDLRTAQISSATSLATFDTRRAPCAAVPASHVLAIIIMALGIGANTAVFSVVNGVLLKPLPYPGADRIVTLSHGVSQRRARARLWSRSPTFATGAIRAPRSRRWPVTAPDEVSGDDGHDGGYGRHRQRRCAVLPCLRRRADHRAHVHGRGSRTRGAGPGARSAMRTGKAVLAATPASWSGRFVWATRRGPSSA